MAVPNGLAVVAAGAPKREVVGAAVLVPNENGVATAGAGAAKENFIEKTFE